MTHLLPALISSLVCCMILTAVGYFLPFVDDKKNLIKKSAVFTAVNTTVWLIFGLTIPVLSYFEKAPSALAAAVLTIICFGGFVLRKYIPHEKTNIFLKRAAIAALVCFIAESFIFNFNRFTQNDKKYLMDLSKAHTDFSDSVSIAPDGIVFSSDGSVIFDVNSKENIRSIRLEFESEDTFLKATIAMKDNNFSNSFISVGSKYFSGKYEKPLDFAIKPYEQLRSFQVNISEMQNHSVKLSSVSMSFALPYTFETIRMLILLAVILAVIAIVTYDLYKITYDSKNRFHCAAIIVLTGICCMSMFEFREKDEIPIDYKADMDLTYKDPYVQMYDAFTEDRLYLETEPDQEFMALENPYDYSQRDGLNYLWDRAYHDGKYYSYYTVVPIFLYYVPYYWINGDLPTMNSTCVFFGILAAITATGAILAFIKKFIKKPNLLLLLVSIAAAPMMTGIYLGVQYSSQYSLPSVVGTFFLLLCLWTGFGAYNRLNEKKSIPLLIISGLAFAACVQSRPSKSISALILAPVFIAILVRREYTIKKKISSAAAFIVPVIIGLVFVFMYNKARFGSYFDFGQAYQLTVSDIHANKIDISLLPSSFVHYFLQPFAFTGDFPYIAQSGALLCNEGKYMYEAANFGIFNLPIILFGFAAAPFFVWHTRHRKTSPYRYNDNRIKSYTYILIPILSVIVAFMDFCVGGIIVDYLGDILPILGLLSIFMALELQSRIEKFPVISGKSVCALSITTVISWILFGALLISIHDYLLHKHDPNMLTELERLICFWH